MFGFTGERKEKSASSSEEMVLELILNNIADDNTYKPKSGEQLWQRISQLGEDSDPTALDAYQTLALMVFEPSEIITALINSGNRSRTLLAKTAGYILYDKAARNPGQYEPIATIATLKAAADFSNDSLLREMYLTL